ncbi:MAG: penicillin-binding protein 2 [Bacteroidota bacterium]|nr:penicillin-binding protein 2 [Bacteroidota bacterium]
MNSFFERRYVIAGIFIAIIITLLARLFYIQIIDDRYALYASNNVRRQVILYPSRGAILDRNGKVLVQNQLLYDITVIPKQVKPFDTVEFCKLLGIDKATFYKQWIKAEKYSTNLSSIFEKQISAEVFASIRERLSEFPGFDSSPRYLRVYPDSVAAQFLGFIGEVTDRDIKKSNGYYHPGDYIGVTGVEKAYETVLKGQRGVRNEMVDSRGRAQGKYANGMFDTVANPGERLTSSLDLRIQRLGERLMKDKVGSIVAIDPSTGEILCFVSSPTYDPNLLVGRERGNNAAKLYNNTYSPMLIRPIQAYYPPGSSFKPLSALIALQEGIITPQTTYFCPHYYMAGNHRVNCEHFDGVTDLRKGIAMSCNTYFCNVFDRVMNAKGPKNTRNTFITWREDVNKFGFGVKLNVDLPNERRGNVPTPLHYDKAFGENHWRSSSIISLAIGQGELLSTPLQMANVECTIANHGYYYRPHLIKAIGDKQITKAEYTQKNYVGIDSGYFEPVIDGMQRVVESGTAAAARIPGIVMCGKTGTAQNPHGKNHSIFVAFAPRDHPKIAIAVIVENSGFGATYAAPIASYIVEKYLKDTISKPQGEMEYIMNKNLLPDTANYKPHSTKKAATSDSLKKLKKDSIASQRQMRSVSRKNKKDTVNRFLATQTMHRDDE